MKIGIPRALLYYYYFPFFKSFFEALGHEVVVSDGTNADIVGKGAAASVSEICVPIKIFAGHTLNLLEKDVDYVFVPRFISAGSRDWYCPKFIGLTELMRHSIEEGARLLPVSIRARGEDIARFRDYYSLCRPLGASRSAVRQALRKAAADFKVFRALCTRGHSAHELIHSLERGEDISGAAVPDWGEHEAVIGVVGYVYNVYDKYVSMDIIERLRKEGIRVVTFDMLDEDSLTEVKKGEKKIFWVFARKLLAAGRHMAQSGGVDGIIHLTAFGCGPDSVIGKMLGDSCADEQVPFMSIRIDEHTGNNHLLTRIEAFVDMIKMRKMETSL